MGNETKSANGPSPAVNSSDWLADADNMFSNIRRSVGVGDDGDGYMYNYCDQCNGGDYVEWEIVRPLLAELLMLRSANKPELSDGRTETNPNT